MSDDPMLKYSMERLVERLAKIKAHYTDLGNALRLVGLFGIDIRYCPEHKSWLIWDEVRWRKDAIGVISQYAKRVAMVMHQLASEIGDEDKRVLLIAWALKSESAQKIQAMIKLAATEHKIPILAKELDANPFLLGVTDGVINLHTGEWLSPRRADYITKQAPIDFDPEATCPLWETFLWQITGGDTELIAYLQRASGYFLTGSTREQCLFILYGPGANGKSVFLRLLQAAIGDYAEATVPELLMVRANPHGPTPELAELRGVRLVVATEPNEDCVLAEATVKRITGEDIIACRFLYENQIKFIPQFKIVLVTNHKPTIHGSDHAIWRRIRLIPFTVIIPPEKQDKKLIQKLTAELPGILNWMLDGVRAYQREGLAPPKSILDATEQYRTEMDVVGEWLNESCIEIPNVETPIKELYASYSGYCSEHGHRRSSKRAFGNQLEERGFPRGRSRNSRFHVGIVLRRDDRGSVLDQTVYGRIGTG